ncbi:hypothetical protein AB1484_35310 [Parafrankia sp. FMc6]
MTSGEGEGDTVGEGGATRAGAVVTLARGVGVALSCALRGSFFACSTAAV